MNLSTNTSPVAAADDLAAQKAELLRVTGEFLALVSQQDDPAIPKRMARLIIEIATLSRQIEEHEVQA